MGRVAYSHQSRHRLTFLCSLRTGNRNFALVNMPRSERGGFSPSSVLPWGAKKALSCARAAAPTPPPPPPHSRIAPACPTSPCKRERELQGSFVYLRCIHHHTEVERSSSGHICIRVGLDEIFFPFLFCCCPECFDTFEERFCFTPCRRGVLQAEQVERDWERMEAVENWCPPRVRFPSIDDYAMGAERGRGRAHASEGWRQILSSPLLPLPSFVSHLSLSLRGECGVLSLVCSRSRSCMKYSTVFVSGHRVVKTTKTQDYRGGSYGLP